MDIHIWNTIEYLKYFYNPQSNLIIPQNVIYEIKNYNFENKNLFYNILQYVNINKINTVQNDKITLNNIIQQLEKEFNKIDSGIINIFNYMKIKDGLTKYIVNSDIYINNTKTKAGLFIESELDKFMKDINNELQNSKEHFINFYKPMLMKKGGLVLRNLFMNIEQILKYFDKQDQYKFSKKLLQQRDELIRDLSDYDATIMFKQNYNNETFQNNFEKLIENTYKTIKQKIYDDFIKLNTNSYIYKIYEQILKIGNIPLSKVLDKEIFDKIPIKLKSIIYINNKKIEIEYNNKDELIFNFDTEYLIRNIYDKTVNPEIKKPFYFYWRELITPPEPQSPFNLLRIMGVFVLREKHLKNTVDIKYNCEILDISIDMVPEKIKKECELEKNNNTIELSFNSILFDNVKMFAQQVPTKPEKRCKRLNIIFSLYNAIYTLVKLKKYNYNLNTEWYENYKENDKRRFVKQLLNFCHGGKSLHKDMIDENTDNTIINNLKFHNIALIFDKLSYVYEYERDNTPDISIKKNMSIYFKEWRKKYVMLFKSFLKNKYKNYYNSLYFVGGTQFELDNDLKFEDKLYNLYTSDIDCVIFIEDKDENDFKEKIKEFYEDFKLFIDENTDKETINLLQNLKIKDIKSNSYWKISNDVKKDLSFKLEYYFNKKFTQYYPIQKTVNDIHPIFTTYDDNYYKFNENGTINYNQSRPYLLLRQSINLKNKECSYLKMLQLLELNIISKTRLFNLYNHFEKTYNKIYTYDTVPYNVVFVFVQMLCYQNINKENKEMINMLYSSWLNYKMNIKINTNLYRFINYATYFGERFQYEEYKNDFNSNLKLFFKKNNNNLISYLSLPEYNKLGKYLNETNISEQTLLSESTSEFNCKKYNLMELEYKEDEGNEEYVMEDDVEETLISQFEKSFKLDLKRKRYSEDNENDKIKKIKK